MKNANVKPPIEGIRFDKLDQMPKVRFEVLESFNQQLDQQLGAISKYTSSLHEQLQENFKPLVEIAQVYQDQAERWELILQKVLTQYNFEMAVPKGIHPHVESLASVVHEMIDEEDSRGGLSDIGGDSSGQEAITWGQTKEYINIAMTIMVFLYTLYTDYQTNQQLEGIKQNQQIIMQQNERIEERLGNLLDEVESHTPGSEEPPVGSN